MKMIFVVVGAAVGLLVVRGFMLDPIEEIGWRMFWDAIFKGNIGSDGMETVFKSATFAKSAIGIAVGCVLGFLAAIKKVSIPTPKMIVKCPDCRELVLKEARKCKHCGCNLVISVSEYARSKGISEEQVMEMIRDGRLYAEKTSGGIGVHLHRVE